MNATKALFKKELLEQWRTSKIIILVVAFLFLGLSGPISLKFLPELLKNTSGNNGISISIVRQMTIIDYATNFFSEMTLLPVLIVILVVMGTISGERERGTAVFVLTKPVSRTQYILTKYGAYWLTIALTIVVTSLAALYYCFLLSENSGTLPVGTFFLVALVMLSNFSFVLALCVLCSSFFKTSVAAGGVTFLVYEVFTIVTPFFAGSLNKYLPYNFVNIGQAALAGQMASAELLIPLAVGAGLASLLLLIACSVNRSLT